MSNLKVLRIHVNVLNVKIPKARKVIYNFQTSRKTGIKSQSRQKRIIKQAAIKHK